MRYRAGELVQKAADPLEIVMEKPIAIVIWVTLALVVYEMFKAIGGTQSLLSPSNASTAAGAVGESIADLGLINSEGTPSSLTGGFNPLSLQSLGQPGFGSNTYDGGLSDFIDNSEGF